MRSFSLDEGRTVDRERRRRTVKSVTFGEYG
jgi:hypothetical protein